MLKKLFDEYISECEYTGGLRPETIRTYKEVFKHFSSIMPEIHRADLLSPEAINRFFKILKTRERVVGTKMIKTSIKNSTINTYGSKLRTFFEWLVKRGHIKENPLKKVNLPEPIYDDIRALSRQSVEKILAAILSQPQDGLMLRRDTLMFYVLLMCGLRKGELLGLQVRDVDMKKEVLTVRGETSKSKKTRTIPIHPVVMMHIREYMLERNLRQYKTQYLFVSSLNDTGLSHHGLKHWVNKLKIRSGVKFHLHQFRHTFATNLGNKNVSIIKIQKLMGHSTPKMTGLYLRSIKSEDSRDEINKMSIEDMS